MQDTGADLTPLTPPDPLSQSAKRSAPDASQHVSSRRRRVRRSPQGSYLGTRSLSASEPSTSKRHRPASPTHDSLASSSSVDHSRSGTAPFGDVPVVFDPGDT